MQRKEYRRLLVHAMASGVEITGPEPDEDGPRSLTIPSGRGRVPHTYDRGALSVQQVNALVALAGSPDFAYSLAHGERTLLDRSGPVVLPWVDTEGRVHVQRIGRTGRTMAHAVSGSLA